uniref:CSON012409 protein n=1 Tax=Culicoides sonorensis TaxID=179676 RepID=A0A336M5I7_CULSO
MKTLMLTYKNAVVKKAIFDHTFIAFGFRGTGHAADSMKGRVNKVDKLIGLSQSFKAENEYLSYVITTSTDRILDILTKKISRGEKFSRTLDKIEQYLNRIQSKYNYFLLITANPKKYRKEEIMRFANELVSKKEKSVYDTIKKLDAVISDSASIHKQFSDNAFQTIMEYLESKRDVSMCESVTASMEVLYSLVYSLIIVYIKAKVMIQYSYNIKHAEKNNSTLTETIESHHYKTEMKNLDKLLTKSIEHVILQFMKYTAYLDTFSYTCRPNIGYIEHKSYERFTNFLTTYISREDYLNHPFKSRTLSFVRCTENCAHFDLSTTSDPNFKSCRGLMRNCKKFLEAPEVCIKNVSSIQPYFSKTTTSCNRNDIRNTRSQITVNFFKCDTCFCTCDTQIGVNYVYIAPVLADPGHVVTGIRFKKSGNTTFLSILSGKPLPMGFVDTSNSTWFDLPSDESPKQNRDKYFRLATYCRNFALPDVKLDRYYVVTGVRFIVNPGKCVINLMVYGTMIDILNGNLIPGTTRSFTVKPCESEASTDFIKMDNLTSGINDHPNILTTGEKTVKRIEFTNSMISDNLGQNTIPYFDTQPVMNSLALVQSGVGLYHRSTPTFAGFVAPRLIAFNLTDYFANTNMKNVLENGAEFKHFY